MSASQEFQKLFTKKQLNKTFENYILYNSATGIDKVNYNTFVLNLEENIDVINRKVKDGSFKFTPYKEKLILKSRTSPPRLISIPTIRDKLVLKSLHLILKEVYKDDLIQPLPQDCIASIKDNVNNYDYFIKIDISDFYGSILHGILFDKLQKKIKKKELLDLIKKAILTQTYGPGMTALKQITKGIPQGLSISNILAHLYMLDFDDKFKSIPDLHYIRYVDDILILCNEIKVNEINDMIAYEIKAILGLEINISKTYFRPLKENFEFLGYQSFHGKNEDIGLTIKKSNKNKFENSIVKLFTKYKYSVDKSAEEFIFTLNNKITGSISKELDGNSKKEYYYGWIFYYKKIDDVGFLYHLDRLVEKLFYQTERCRRKVNFNDIKKFHTTFFEVNYNLHETTYIHKPDELNINEQRELLKKVFQINDDKLTNDNKIEKMYKKLVYKPIKEFEKDVISY